MAKLRFRMKPGVGQHTMSVAGMRTVLKPGDEVTCEKELLASFMDKFEQLDPDPPPPQPKKGLKAVARGGGWYDVINESTGKPINDKPLRKADAEELVGSVEPQTEAGVPNGGQPGQGED